MRFDPHRLSASRIPELRTIVCCNAHHAAIQVESVRRIFVPTRCLERVAHVTGLDAAATNRVLSAKLTSLTPPAPPEGTTAPRDCKWSKNKQWPGDGSWVEGAL